MSRVLLFTILSLCAALSLKAQEEPWREYELQNITLTESRIVERQSFKNSVIDSTLISANISASLGDLIALKTPIFIKNYGVGGAQTPSFRGTGASHTQVYWNGINLNSPMLGQVDLSLFPVAFSDEIAVNYGGASLAHGTGGLGGALHMNSSPVWDQPVSIRASQSVASFGNYISNLSVSNSNDKISNTFKAYYKSAQNDFEFVNVYQPEYPVWTNEHADQEQYGFLDEFDWRINDEHQLGAKIWMQAADRNLPPSMDKNVSYAEQEDASTRIMLNYAFHRDKWHVEVNNAYIKDYIYYYDDRTRIESESDVDILQSVANVAYEWTEKFHLKGGYRLNYDQAHSDNYRDLDSGEKVDRDQMTFDVFASAEWMPITDLSVSALLRQQWIDGDAKPILPSLGVDYTLMRRNYQKISIRANGTRNFHAPTLNDRYWYPVGNPDLLPEEGWQAEFGAQWDKLSHQDSDWSHSVGLTAFASWIENWIIWKPGVSNLWRPENLKKVYSRGLEAILQSTYKQSDWVFEGFLSLSYNRSENQEAYHELDNSVGHQLIYTPVGSAQGYLRGSYKTWTLMLEEQMSGERNVQTDGSEYLPAYYLTNMVLSKDLHLKGSHQMNLQFRANNIFDYHYQSIARKPMPGRNFMLTVSYKFR